MARASVLSSVETYEHVEAFAAHTWAFLAADPVRRNVLATTVEAARTGGQPDGSLWFVVRGDDGTVVGTAMQTPPYGPALSDMPVGAGTRVADALIERDRRHVSMASGPGEVVAAFAERWSELTGVRARPGHAMGVFALRRLRDPPATPGMLRAVGSGERELVAAWAHAFAAELLPEPVREDTAARTLTRPGLYVWDHGGPVCLVAHTGPGAGVVRIGPVYTPPTHRRRGYAAAATAAVSGLLLDAGWRCMLFTDLANPTSNGVYRRIGYEQVGEARYVLFDQALPARD